jgi:hypothetical protein
MTCPRCGIGYNTKKWGECPHCGAGASRVLSGVMRTSTILISAGDEDDGIYRSFEEVPEPLRKLLAKSTSGANAGTIFIADERGRQEIAKAIRNLPNTLGSSTLTKTRTGPISIAIRKSRVRVFRTAPAAIWLGLLVTGFACGVCWLVYSRVW